MVEIKGMILDIYRWSFEDCSNNGISNRYKKVLLIGDHIPKIHAATVDLPIVKLAVGPGNSVRLIPLELRDKWVMFGGAFCWTSHSGFDLSVRKELEETLKCKQDIPYVGQPIKLFDRYEGELVQR
jgi:hypothetical protein